MSILSQLLHKQISWSQAASEIEGWFGHLPAPIQADAQAAKTQLKQSASDALGLADTALGPIFAAGAVAAEGAANTAFTALGVSALSVPADAAIVKLGDVLKGAIDAEIASLRARLAPAAAGAAA